MYQNTVWRKQLFFFLFFLQLWTSFIWTGSGLKNFQSFTRAMNMLYTCESWIAKAFRFFHFLITLFNYTSQKKIFYTRKIFNICTIDNKFTFILIIIHKLLPIENIANFVIITFQEKLRNSFLHHHPREINNSP